MASHVPGIEITIKAFLRTGKTLDEQYAALTLVKDAHASGDYSEVLKSSKIEVKAEQKTRRFEDEPKTIEADKGDEGTQADDKTDDGAQMDVEDYAKDKAGEAEADHSADAEQPDDNVPEFIKKGKKTAA
jgi:hypothetical protein